MTKEPEPTFAEVLVQESPDALLALSEEGKVLYWNAGASAVFGFTRDEAIGRALDEMIVPEDRRDEARRALVEAIEKGPAVVFETVRCKKDGARIEVDVTMKGVRDDTGSLRFIAVNKKDVTALKRLREARSAEEKFRHLLEAAPDAMVIADGAGLVQLVNARAESLFGYARNELLGQPVEVLIPERYRAAHPGHRGSYFTEPRMRPMGSGGLALFGRKKDGTEFPAEISLSPLETEEGTVAITAIRDVTERVRNEEQLRRREAENAALEAKTAAETTQRVQREFLAKAGEVLTASSLDYRMTLATVARLAVPELADWCSVELLEPGATAPLQVAVAHADPRKVQYARELNHRARS